MNEERRLHSAARHNQFNHPHPSESRCAEMLAELARRVAELEQQAPATRTRARRDAASEAAARGCAQVDGSVREYHRRLRENDWPDW
jgi:hypothetical protein